MRRTVNVDRTLRSIALAAMTTLGLTHVAQGITYNSSRTTGGNWSTAAQWSHTPAPPAPVFPNNGADDYLVGLGSFGTTLNVNVLVSSLSIAQGGSLVWSSAAGNTLAMDNGPISNNGAMSLNAGDALAVFGNVTLSGSGAVTLDDTTARIISTAGGGRLRVNGHTISGQGTIGGGGGFNLTNDGGMIIANGAGATLTVDVTDDFTQINGGILRAAGGSTLSLNNSFFNNAGGTIEAMGGGNVVLRGADILGGMLSGGGSGAFRIPASNSARLDSLSLTDGTNLNVENGAALDLRGTITNGGHVELQSTGFTSSVRINGPVTLRGSGSISLDHVNEQIILGAAGAHLTQEGGHTIEGFGTVGGGLRFTNDGLISANRGGQALRLNLVNGVGAATNTGTLLATSGGLLAVFGLSSEINNTGGVIQATNGSTVQLSQLTITGGELRGSGGSSFVGLSNVHLRDLLHDTVFDVGPSVFLNGSIENQGIFNIPVNGRINLDGDTTLSGFGDITLTGNAAISKSGLPLATLNNQSNLIRGAGNVGGGQISVVNAGTIDARVPGGTLTLQPALTGSFTNTGTLTASDGGILHLFTGTFNNNGNIVAEQDSTVVVSPTILNQGPGSTLRAASNATVEVRGNAVINGGRLVTSGSGGALDQSSRVRVTGSESRFNNVNNQGFLLVDGGNAVAQNMTSSGLIRITNPRQLGIESMLTLNGGSVEVNGGTSGSGSVLRIRNAATITGDGTVTLSGLGTVGERLAFIFGSGADPELTNQVTIRGEGVIAGGIAPNRLRLVNDNQIIATGKLDLTLDSATGGFDLVNNGTLATNGTGELLVRNDVSNLGAIVANSGGTVTLDRTTVDASGAAAGGGLIFANSGTVLLDQRPGSGFDPVTRIIGGTLQTASPGRIVNPTFAVLDGATGVPVTIAGRVLAESGSNTTITGTIAFNGGLIELDPSDAPLTRMSIQGTTVFTGTGDVWLNFGLGGITPPRITGILGTASNLANGPGMTISGTGVIGGNGLSLVNQGLISTQDFTGLDLVSIPVDNTGTLQAGSNATLRLNGAQITNVGGTIEARDNATVQLSNSTTIDGGVLDTFGAGVIRNISSARLIALIDNRGLFETANGATTTVEAFGGSASLLNVGTIALESEGAPTTLNMDGTVEFIGGGTIRLSDDPNNRITGSNANDAIVNTDNTIRGAGSIGQGQPLANDAGGFVIADGVNPLTLIDPRSNRGTMEARGSGGLRINKPSVFLNDIEGVIEIRPGSRLDVVGGPGVINAGELFVDGSMTVGTLSNFGELGGSGTINGLLTNNATFSPQATSGSSAQTATMTINGDYQQPGLGKFRADIEEAILLTGGGLLSDRLVVTGHANLGGTLEVSFVDDAVALPGDAFTVLSFGSRSGDVVIINDTPYPGLQFNKIYDATSLTLNLDALGGDANLDARVNLQDFNVLAANFGVIGANWLTADFTGDGIVNLLDFNRLAANFGLSAAGPGVTARDWATLAATVPEPSAALSALLIATVPFLRRQSVRTRCRVGVR
jgi:hypothetical protein